MGYRSQVRCVIYGPDDLLTAYIATWQLQHGNKLFTQFEGSLRRYKANISILNKETSKFEPGEVSVLDLSGDGWKWYDSYWDVQEWSRFMNEAVEYGLEREFIRIGEERTDVEEHQSSNCAFMLSTTSPQITDDIDEIEASEQPVHAL